MREPCLEIKTTLKQIWENNFKEYDELNGEELLNILAKHYLNRVPEKDEEILPRDQYKKIASAFQNIKVPRIAKDRVDHFPSTNEFPIDNLQGILDVYNRIKQL